MKAHRTRNADPTKILFRSEITAILRDLQRKGKRSPSTRLNLIVFRLATCCGLRASEIANLRIGDVRVETSRPHIRIRVGAAKGGWHKRFRTACRSFGAERFSTLTIHHGRHTLSHTRWLASGLSPTFAMPLAMRISP